MGKIRGLDGSLINAPEKPSILVDQEHYLNLVARVQNLEACLVMVAQIAQRSLAVHDADEIDIVMQAYYEASLARGARHLEREPTNDNPAIFI